MTSAAAGAATAKSTIPPAEPVPVEPIPATAAAPSATTVAPAGWYPVAAGAAQQRWWDGTRWTEHVYEPPAAARINPAPAVPQETLRAPAGVKPDTVWFWLMAVGAPVLSILSLIPTSIYLSQLLAGDFSDPTTFTAKAFGPEYLLVLLCGWFIYAVCIVFALLDWRELNARGVPKPFHWAWSFFVLAVGWPAVYVIGRTVVVKRRTGSGMAPLWVFVGLQVVAFVVTFVVVISALAAFLSQLSYSFRNFG